MKGWYFKLCVFITDLAPTEKISGKLKWKLKVHRLQET